MQSTLANDGAPALPGPTPLHSAMGSARSGHLSLNEIPSPIPSSVLREIDSVLPDISRHPDPTCARLVQAIARHHGSAPDDIVVGPGRLALATGVALAAASDGAESEIIFLSPTLEGISTSARIARMSQISVPLSDAYAQDLQNIGDLASSRTRLVYLCNPNEPTGVVLERRHIERLLHQLPPMTTVLVDQTYADFVDAQLDVDVTGLQRHHPNLIVLRSFSAADGLAGLPAGYVIAKPPLVHKIHEYMLPFTIDTIAQAAATASLNNIRQREPRIRNIIEQRESMHRELSNYGYRSPKSGTNFLWIQLGPASLDFAVACREAGIDVRLYSQRGVRASVGRPEENQMLLRVARDFAIDRDVLGASHHTGYGHHATPAKGKALHGHQPCSVGELPGE
ncbi:aminotransferase class I/II-fold pyridoxal phosphate-dependent enzyme [Streptomyces caniferus]|uniref:pyridoxal phosphate-dependent aminotransferase n=1 Tax=Streptomyces caniferus TaxID=285557 RepID=UPI003452DBFF